MPKESAAEVTSAPELSSTSEAEQMYLITVARETESGSEGPVRVSLIADVLGVSIPSANEMIRKLDGRGLLSYEPYRGVQLSAQGRTIADQVLRTRRLWATFLAEHLGFSPADADDQACHLEHATSPEAANRLATFLGNPEAGPLGRPIPAPATVEARRATSRLTDLTVGTTAEVIATTAPERALDFLHAEGIAVGSTVTIAGVGDSGYLLSSDGATVHVDHTLAASIEVRAVGEHP